MSPAEWSLPRPSPTTPPPSGRSRSSPTRDGRPQEISIIARDPARAARIAGERAWYPGKDERGPTRMLRRLAHRLPRAVRARYRAELAAGRIVIVAAAGGQPSDTLAALLARAGGSLVDQWWQEPADLFAPPEMAGPF